MVNYFDEDLRGQICIPKEIVDKVHEVFTKDVNTALEFYVNKGSDEKSE